MACLLPPSPPSRLGRIHCARSSSSSSASIDGGRRDSQAAPMDLASAALNALFSYKPFFKIAAGRARRMIVERGAEIGHPWEPELARLRVHDWESELEAVRDKNLVYPEYYLKPFHAYENGNLSWDAALEVDLAAKSVHANVFDPEARERSSIPTGT